MKLGPHALMEYPVNHNAFFLFQKVHDMALIREGAQSPRKIITGFADFWRSSQFFGRQRQTVKIGYGLLLAPDFDYDFIARHNESPKPFVWTKSAAAILEKVNRARTALRSQ